MAEVGLVKFATVTLRIGRAVAGLPQQICKELLYVAAVIRLPIADAMRTGPFGNLRCARLSTGSCVLR